MLQPVWAVQAAEPERQVAGTGDAAERRHLRAGAPSRPTSASRMGPGLYLRLQLAALGAAAAAAAAEAAAAAVAAARAQTASSVEDRGTGRGTAQAEACLGAVSFAMYQGLCNKLCCRFSASCCACDSGRHSALTKTWFCTGLASEDALCFDEHALRRRREGDQCASCGHLHM